MKRSDFEIVLEGLEEARRLLGLYIEPGPSDAAATVNRVLEILDHDEFIAAMERLKGRMTLRLVQ